MFDYQDFEFLTQTQLGHIFGVGPKVIGKWLVEVGLRTPDLHPSAAAWDGGYCKFFTNDRGIVFVVWHRAKAIDILKAGGRAPAYEQGETALASKLIGPFSLFQTSEDGFQVRNGDGSCCVWVRGETTARKIAALFNNIHERGGFGK